MISKIRINRYLMGGVSLGLGVICLMAADPCDEAGSAPTATITAPTQVTNIKGENVAGLGFLYTFSATLTDGDIHKDSPSSTPDNKPDEFKAAGAIKWSERSGKGLFDDDSKSTVKWTVSTPGDYEIVLKVKDDGVHYQDLSALTEVASYKIKVVYPDGVRISSQSGGLTRSSATAAMATAPLTFQVTYGGQDLKWKGKLAEKIWLSAKFKQVLAMPYASGGIGAAQFGGNWNKADAFANSTSDDGQLSESHDTGIGSAPPNGYYIDLGGKQEIGYVDKSGNVVSLKAFTDEDYVHTDASGEHHVHNEQ